MKFPVPFFGGTRTARLNGLVRIIGLVLVLAMAGALQACSAIKIAYNQATELAFWRLDGYLDFTEAQTAPVRQALAGVHQWHRQTQLPAYVGALQKWQAWMPGELEEAQACELVEEVRTRLLAISERSEAAALPFVATLEPQQLDHLKRKFSKLNAEYRDDFLDGTPQALLDKRVKKAVSRAEMLYGTLEAKQVALIRSRLMQSPFDARVSLAEHQRRQQDALRTLAPLIAGQSTLEQVRPALRGYFERAVNSPDPAYRRYQAQLTQDGCKTLAELHNSTTAAQRASAVQTLKGYEQDLKILVAQRG